MPKGKILVVDDDTAICSSLSSILSDEGFEVETAESAEYCLELLGKTDFDLILLDIWLPGMHGLMALEEIIKRKINVSVVIISAHGSIEMAVKATKLGAFDFLEKPLNLDKVILSIRHSLDLSRLSSEYQRLRKELIEEEELIGKSPSIVKLKESIEKVAPTEGWVLITGENGTGKEVIAKMIHKKSLRSEAPFIAVNCAAIPDELIESELFGYEKGAFTGAEKTRAGKFESADGGTIFFDEIGDMGLATQAKVLRVLQEQEFQKLGGTETIRVDVRVIAATNKDLEVEMKKGAFREDLFYRLNVIPLYIPPLRERKEDIPLLVEHFLKFFTQRSRLRSRRINPQVIDALMQYPWPGNVRELKNIIERMVILSSTEEIGLRDLPPGIILGEKDMGQAVFSGSNLKQARNIFERQFILRKLIEQEYNIQETASQLGLDKTTLYRKLKYLGINLEKIERETALTSKKPS